jgi:Myosin N-terminal SH3-like domain
LIVSPELKLKLKSKPYDPKKSCWVPNKATHGYDEGLIESSDGEKVTVMILENKEVMFIAFTCSIDKQKAFICIP